MDIHIVIVSYNVAKLLGDCLASVYASQDVEFAVTVVDNGSRDGSVEVVRDRFPQAELIISPRNGGFAYGNNLALSRYFTGAGSRGSGAGGRGSGVGGQSRRSDAPVDAAAGSPVSGDPYQPVDQDALSLARKTDLGADRSPNDADAAAAAGSRSGDRSYQSGVGNRPVEGDQPVAPAQPSTLIPASPKYVLLLNPDTVLPPDALARMVAYLDRHPEAGAAGPRLIRGDGSLDLACRRSFPTPEVAFYRIAGLSKLFPKSRRFGRYNLTYLDPDVETEVDSVVGAFMMVRYEAFLQLGLLDETFFMYGEDLDWAFRLKELGWSVRYNPAVTVVHLKGQSSRQRPFPVIREFYRAMSIFYQKHYAARYPAPVGWLVLGAINGTLGIAVLTNLLKPRSQRRVGAA